MKKKFDNGGPAFPYTNEQSACGAVGIFLWDYFAAHAPMEDFTDQFVADHAANHVLAAQERARMAADFADAMIAERKKRME